MQCPVCTDTALAISSREGVEIDYCPQCRGVWLDRGELDKIIDRVAAAPAGSRAACSARDLGLTMTTVATSAATTSRRRTTAATTIERRDPRDVKRRKKRSFLDDLFDFD